MLSGWVLFSRRKLPRACVRNQIAVGAAKEPTSVWNELGYGLRALKHFELSEDCAVIHPTYS